VYRVFFPHQHNASGFIRAAETLFRIPDVRMSENEEQQFIRFYKLPTDRLRCNKLIRLELLTDIFPRLEAMFSAAEVGGVNGQVIGTLIPRPASDRPSTTDQQTTTTSTTSSNDNSDDSTRPRKRRRHNVCSDVIVID